MLQHRFILEFLSYSCHRRGLATFTWLHTTTIYNYHSVQGPFTHPHILCRIWFRIWPVAPSISPTITQLCGGSLRDTDTQGSQTVDKQACGGRGGEEVMGNELVDNLSLPVIFAHTHTRVCDQVVARNCEWNHATWHVLPIYEECG